MCLGRASTGPFMSAILSPSAAAAPAAGDNVDQLLRGIVIPPRPSLLADVQKEIASSDPDLARLAQLIGRDVAMSAAVLHAVNSPFYGLTRRVDSLAQAVSLLGLRPIGSLVTGLLLRQALPAKGPNLTRFWDVSAKRSFAMVQLARRLRGVDADQAHAFGLFCDVGIPLLMQRFTDYVETLKQANAEAARAFTAVERERHQTDHALVGSLMARTWGAPVEVCQAIRLHHDYALFHDAAVPEPVSRMVAMGLVAERAIQLHAGMNRGSEWDKAGESAAGTLMLSGTDVEDWQEDLLASFAEGRA